MVALARVLLDAGGLITGWSEQATALVGYRAEEVVGRPLWSLLTGPAEGVSWPVPREPPMLGGFRVTMRDRSGLPLDIELWMCPLLDAASEAGWVVFLALARGADPGEFDRAVLDALLTQSPVGLHLMDTDLQVVRFNTASSGMRGVRPEEIIGRRGRDVAPSVVTDVVEHLLRQVLDTGEPVIDFVQAGYPPADPRRQRVFSMSAFRLQNPAGDTLGVASIAIDVTDRYRDRVRLELLNDASRRIGTRLDVTGTAEELAEVAAGRVADAVSVDILDAVYHGEAPAPGPLTDEVTVHHAAFRTAEAAGLQPAYAVGQKTTFDFPTPFTQCLSDLRPRLVGHVDDEAEWLARDPLRAERLRTGGVHSLMTVPLTARGVVLGVAGFYRSATREPFDEDDLTVVTEMAARAAVCVDNARRYARERTAALALQSSLLPQTQPAQNALDVASCHLPTSAGGGGWYDVIPLSGARTAVAVGQVAGHGMHVAATMGRLRSVTHSLAALDLTPEEVLAHLDDLMVHLAEEARQAADDRPSVEQPTMATCVYAVYDPIAQCLTLARAGHAAPVVAYPDGLTECLQAPEGPPLGGNGLPFEAAEVSLPEGSLIALFTDSLTRREAPDGHSRLRRVLAHPGASVQETCDAVIYAELAGRPAEGVVLLVAQTRVLGDDAVASWTFPSDPAIVATARTLADRQLANWGLSELVFTTEVVVSELITNAIRYAGGTIQLRLIRDRALICEVTDNSSAAPHLRHPRTTDEGGRGLLLIAQLTHRWGTRHTHRGKTIWTEQPLTPHRP
ncbi:SpoIIE family protein phosphatase [Kitasatospora sp. NPDC018058]|uniref:SpoIIE family protein phosphatase n=1 Tax=Kitasatospora sp. NPDC018058 TaxID=3364025 RepID=UPI0037BF5B4F